MGIFDFDNEKIRSDFIHGNSFRDLAHIDIDNRIPMGFHTKLVDPEDLPLMANGKRKAIVCTRVDWETGGSNLSSTINFLNSYGSIDVILITYGSYLTPDRSVFDNIPECVVKWYAVNAEYENDKVVGIPLGIAKPIWENGQISSLIKNRSDTKDKLLYINHNPNTDRTSPRGNIRRAIYDRFRSEGGDWFTLVDQFGECNLYGYNSMEEMARDKAASNMHLAEGVKERGRRIFEEGSREVGESSQRYIREMSSHKFTLAPSGMGYDTMRTWEALYSKTIPIVTDYAAMKHFEDLPILYTEDYSEITEDYLNKKYEEFQEKDWDLSKMFFSYWKNRIMDDYNDYNPS
tara:strand:- start:1220 stop:2260 length:1041 start_codon:yes stop_codon:yes gene_type:complete